jgi:hypothetical protein
MSLTNSRAVEGEQTNQDRARAAIQTYHAKPDKRSEPGFNPVSRSQRLDVDAVLARSLPRVVGEPERETSSGSY